jgi:hypothetical protein
MIPTTKLKSPELAYAVIGAHNWRAPKYKTHKPVDAATTNHEIDETPTAFPDRVKANSCGSRSKIIATPAPYAHACHPTKIPGITQHPTNTPVAPSVDR